MHAPTTELALRVAAAPPTFFAKGQTYRIVVEITNRTGAIRLAPSDVTVSLFSSRSEVGSVEPAITIPARRTYGVALFRSTGITGTSTITASPSGYTSGSVEVRTAQPRGVPAKLAVFPAPSTIIPDPGRPIGDRWYPEGAPATFSVDPAAEGFLVRQVFRQWTGPTNSTQATTTLVMDGPKHVIAVWRTDFGQTIALGIVAGIGAVIGVFYRRVRRRRRAAVAEEEAEMEEFV